ncbi:MULTISPECIES: four helix bundle protein [unclassified Butyricimonas]|uniref:four helix bundle protein n=1 Tax=unclassified Butyricimonas TaxID=2637652 RepID=UPI000C06B813|nr:MULTISPECIES: four helix bundle protein [unclassified Butyricimonas]
MDKVTFKYRTKQLGLAVIRLVEKLPRTQLAKVVCDQILRSSLSVGANYRAVCRAKSDKDFISKMKIVEEECDETVYWLEIMEEAHLLSESDIAPLKKEANELVAMIVASIKTKSYNLESEVNRKSKESLNHKS